MTSESFTRVARVSDVAPGTSLLVTVAGKEILLCNSKDQITAIINKCSHADEKLECGRIRNGWISCPAHGARFSLETGQAMNHPATLPIQTFPTRIVDEWVEVQA
ncbi:Rieske 2Fe-2S domain-containing protein [Phenylobacterium sp. LjRoot225]|uniref:Rieske (2Fe-2S) protein n=1 Tax=Phenylobacterium sp. LjRoot225 TaxID=3342285 RepID=UPI003ECDCAFF